MTEEGAGEDAWETWQLDELRTRNRPRYGAESKPKSTDVINAGAKRSGLPAMCME